MLPSVPDGPMNGFCSLRVDLGGEEPSSLLLELSL